MGVYIQGIGNISIQNTFGQKGFSEPVWYNEPYVRCIDPDFRNFFGPTEARRMSRLIKRAIVTAKECIADSGIVMPDAIISGTGLGSIDDTEKFLSAMIENDEKFLQPTFFIQSTHNTVSSQIAISLKCNGHNNTFVHGGISFESALTEAMLLFEEKRVNTALVGGYDEMTPAYFKLLGRVGFWKKDPVNSFELNKTDTTGAFAGEGSVSVMLSDTRNDKTYARIEAIEVLYQPENLEQSVEAFLNLQGKKCQDIDLIVLGMNGDSIADQVYRTLAANLFRNKAHAWFKHLSGEYFTSAGFGLWFAATCLKQKKVPPFAALNRNSPGNIDNILFVNHYRNKNFSLILFSAC